MAKTKYSTWITQIAPRIMRPIATPFISTKATPITRVTLAMMLSLVFMVMDFDLTKLARCFSYRLVPKNQACRRSEPFAKQNAVAR